MLYNSPKSLLDSVTTIMNESKVKFDKEQRDIEEAQKAVWEAKLSPKQKKIAAVAGDPKKIDAADFKELRKEEVAVEEGIADTAKKVVKKIGKVLGGPDDKGQLKDLQRKMGLPQTGKKPTVKEQAELDEARGRPRKNPTPEASSEDEADNNIVMHLKKSLDTGGNHDVKFADKTTHKVPHHVAHHVLTAMGKLKPADRLEVQKHIQQSHKNLMQVHGMIK